MTKLLFIWTVWKETPKLLKKETINDNNNSLFTNNNKTLKWSIKIFHVFASVCICFFFSCISFILRKTLASKSSGSSKGWKKIVENRLIWIYLLLHRKHIFNSLCLIKSHLQNIRDTGAHKSAAIMNLMVMTQIWINTFLFFKTPLLCEASFSQSQVKTRTSKWWSAWLQIKKKVWKHL